MSVWWEWPGAGGQLTAGVNDPSALRLQEVGEAMGAGFVLSHLGSFPTQLHLVLHQVQGLHKNCSSYPSRPANRNLTDLGWYRVFIHPLPWDLLLLPSLLDGPRHPQTITLNLDGLNTLIKRQMESVF